MMSWLLKLVGDYFRLSIFAVGILLGVQIPAFVDQYEKRVDAHLIEAKEILKGFQFTANRYFDGNIDRLIDHYKNSKDPVFIADADNIQLIVNRVAMLEGEFQSLQTTSLDKIWHVTTRADSGLRQDTFNVYSYSIVMDRFSIAFGCIFSLIVIVLIDLLMFALGRLMSKLWGEKRRERDYF